MKRIAIYGGSFNPIHRGHIALGQFVCNQGFADELWFLVSPQNPFKQRSTDLLEDEARLNLAQKAIETEQHLRVCDIEFHLPRPSYMYKTLDALSEKYPDCHFLLIIGADNWLAFDRWAEYRYILEHYEILIFPRTGYPVEESELPPQVQLLHSPIIDISATEIRQRILSGEDVSGMLPHRVWEEICRNQYYKPKNETL